MTLQGLVQTGLGDLGDGGWQDWVSRIGAGISKAFDQPTKSDKPEDGKPLKPASSAGSLIEKAKPYLPWIAGAAVAGFLILRRRRG